MMKFEQAQRIAGRVLVSLSPHCERIEIAGSIRRRRPTVNDIEIVCIPYQAPTELFGEGLAACAGFCNAVAVWPRVRGRATGRYTQRTLPEGIALDIFIARPENWGYILAIRTGSSAFSHDVLACRWVKLGYKGDQGVLRDRHGNAVELREEKELFDLLGFAWVEPECRQRAYLPPPRMT